MLSKVARKVNSLNTKLAAQKHFSTNLPATATPDEVAHAKSLQIDNKYKITMAQFSNRAKQMRVQSDEENAEYLAMLNDTQARQSYFSSLAQADSSDHAEVAKVKNRINKLIAEEIALAGFENQVSSEEAAALGADTYQEVATKSNYYFSLDEGKVDKNIKVYNMAAPGNKFRHPNVILPHENVNIQ